MSNEPPDDQGIGPAVGGPAPLGSGDAGIPDFARRGRHAAPPVTDGASVTPAASDQQAASRRARHRQAAPRSRRRTALLALVGAFVVVLGLLIGATTFETKQLDANVTRIDNALPPETADRPAESVEEAQTFLVAGLEQVPGSERPLLDTVLLLHATSDRSQAQVVAVPVDTWVPGAGDGSTVADGFRDGGAAGLVTTVEALSDVRVDHYLQLDFDGFRQVIDDLGGVDIDVPQAYANRGYEFPAGRQHLDGTAALAYVRDFGPPARATTALRQQAVVTAMFGRAKELGALSDLGTLTGLLSTVTDAVSVDETVSDTDLVGLAWDLRGIGQPAFLSLPTTGPGEEAGRSVQYVDDGRASALWGHLRDDTLSQHLDEFR
jgi:LCP family protein required for cell wall assembly